MQKLKTIVLMLALLAAAGAEALTAGASRADITPDPLKYQVPLAGYGDRLGKVATGVHDRLYVKVLVLKDERHTLALVTCDLRSVTPQLKQQIVEKAAAHGFTPDNLFMCASHTHSGPSIFPERFWQMQFGEHDPAIVENMSSAIALALAEATETAGPATVGFAECMAKGFTKNRRWKYGEEERRAAGETPVVDEKLWVMRVDRQEGGVLAVLSHFATHPTILGAENLLISGDWPGAFQRAMEDAFPDAVALYMNGAQGDQAPDGAQGGDPFARVEDFGKRLAAVAAAAARDAKTSGEAQFAIRSNTVKLPEFEFPEKAKELYAAYLPAAMEALPRRVEIQTVTLGDHLLVGLPGEPLYVAGEAVRDRMAGYGFQNVLTVGLANDYIGYIVNRQEWARGGYEVESRSYYGPDLADFLADYVRFSFDILSSRQKRN